MRNDIPHHISHSAYGSVISNSERIGWTNEQYKEAWDAEHSGDPLVIPDD